MVAVEIMPRRRPQASMSKSLEIVRRVAAAELSSPAVPNTRCDRFSQIGQAPYSSRALEL